MKIFKVIIPVLILCLTCIISAHSQENNKEGDVYKVVEKMPEYPGGKGTLRSDIAANVKYPEKAKKEGISGKVYIKFVVDEKGKVVEPEIARGVDPSLDKEAIRVISLLKTWEPGMEKGKAVKVAFTVPINFALDSNNSTNKKGDVYFKVDEMPKFPGGDNALRAFITKSVKYPDAAKKKGKQGKVYVSFVIDKDGSVTNAKVERGVCLSLDKESIRVVESIPEWKPGKENGELVKVQFTVPINFALK